MAQPKGTNKAAIDLENKARELLSAILPESIDAKSEMGAVICRDDKGGALAATALRTAGAGLAVDVGLEEPNCGCPAGTTPVAYYHTHPIALVKLGPGIMGSGDPDFSPKDKWLGRENQVIAFLGSFDGKMRRCDPVPVPTVMVNGKKVQMATDAEGKPLPETYNPTVILNGSLPTVRFKR